MNLPPLVIPYDMARRISTLPGSLGTSHGRSFARSLIANSYNMRLVSPICQHSSEFERVNGIEENYCKDFVCCGLQLPSMHDLLQHYEEAHHELDSDVDMMDEDDEMFELDSDSESNDNMNFQQSLYDDVRTSNFSSPYSSMDYDYYNRALRACHIEDAPMTIPYRFDQPTIVISDQFMSSTDMGSSTDSEPTTKRPKTGLRPFKCEFEGCIKSYKNPGGLKYHSLNGHNKDSGDAELNKMIEKPYECTVAACSKRYKNLNGLKYHIEHAHASLFMQ